MKQDVATDAINVFADAHNALPMSIRRIVAGNEIAVRIQMLRMQKVDLMNQVHTIDRRIVSLERELVKEAQEYKAEK